MSVSSHFNIPNETETLTKINIESCLTTAATPLNPAIDEYEETSKKLIVLAGQADAQGNKFQVRLLLLGLVSSCEYYFRRVLSETVSSCPISRAHCSRHDVKYSAATYFAARNIGLALTDDAVFSGAHNIETETKRLTGISVSDSTSLKEALSEYQKVCVIRHASVHSYGLLGGKNFSELDIDSTGNCEVALTSKSFQEIADVCLNLVRAYNRQLWTTLVSRMNSRGNLKFNDSEKDRDLFFKIASVFWSQPVLLKIGDIPKLYVMIMTSLKQADDLAGLKKNVA